jgi:type IV pilus assembly protein PilP
MIRNTVGAIVCLALFGCGDGGVQEVQQWMDDTKRETKVVVPKVSEPKKFTPFIYEARNAIDPYDPAKLEVALAKAMARSSNSAFKPDLNRRREPLESYPLDTVKMVGTLNRQGLSYALLQADRTIYHVKMGNYVGQNFGMITAISENEVELKEIVQDAVGDWIERKAKLELQESGK